MSRYNFLIGVLLLGLVACNSSNQTKIQESKQEIQTVSVALPSEEESNKIYTLAFYNVENLFDTIDSPDTDDAEFLPNAEKQWKTVRYRDKLAKISEVISKIGDADGAEIIGLCEIENKAVLTDLVAQPSIKKANYGIVHYDSPDKRGIDVALLYKQKEFTVESSQAIPMQSFRDDQEEPHTRDILKVTLVRKSDKLTVFVVHFPSRREGKERSEFKRVAVAKQLRTEIDKLLEKDKQTKFAVIGDFNDEPTDKSLTEVLQADNSQKQDDRLFNALYDIKLQGKGTYYHQGNWDMIDNIILSDGLLLAEKGLRYVSNSAGIYAPEHLKQQEPEKFKGAPHRTYAGNRYLGGYSDHFAVYINMK